MKPNPIPVIAAWLLFSVPLAAQQDSAFRILLKSGAIVPEKNITKEKLEQFDRIAFRSAGKTFAVIQFEKIPTAEEKLQLKQSGIELLDYIPNNAYTSTITGGLNRELLLRLKARAVVDLTPRQKMQPQMAEGKFPSWSVKIAGTVDVWISYPKSYDYETVRQELRNRNFDIISIDYREYSVLALRVSTRRLDELASLPFIEYVEPAPHEAQPLNNISTANSRAHVLNSSLTGGRNLRGSGVVMGIGDDSDPLRHIDFTGRLINRAPLAGGTHGVHVEGVAAGGGINFELFTGAAPKVTVIAQAYSGLILNAVSYVQDYGMVVTNNSYGNVIDDCSTFGTYTLTSRILDLQAFSLPRLQHIYATGNSGIFNCAPYPNSFGTVLGDFQSAKNIVDVGNTSSVGVIDVFSSRGPVRDGRIKPEIMAQGVNVGSTWPTNSYAFQSGTSMSSPAVAGGVALLIESYRISHGGVSPKNGLMKAVLCNGATDIGNRGPDYSNGFGWLNLLRSIKMLENNSYVNDSLANGNIHTYNLVIPANIGQLKVMLYWNDPAAAVLAAHTLVNDLDLDIVDPAMQPKLPYVLDTLPANVNAAANTGVDHINNIEQIVINNPVAGNYAINVRGTTVTQNPRQEYFLVYDTIPVSTTLVYPIGGERLNQGLSTYISWDSYGDSIHTFSIDYSIDGGSNWLPINGNVAANVRQLAWTVPAVQTERAKIRVTQNVTGISSTSEAFIIIDLPTLSLATIQCEGYFGLKWTKVTGATDYEVMMLKGDEMVSMGTTTDSNFVISGLSKDTVYWAAVRARLLGVPGRRSAALSRQPNSGSCSGIISDNDIKVDSILSPASSGRQFTSTALSATTPLTVRIKNLDDAVTTQNIDISYSINGATPVVETLINPAIAAGATFSHTFSPTINLSVVGSYSIKIGVSQGGDPEVRNDTLVKVFKQLDNAPITGLTTPFVDDLETAVSQTVTSRQRGLEGLDRYDFVTSGVFGRLRTFVNSGIAYSGSKAITLDADRFVGGNTDSLTGTFNLATYNVASDDIRFDFRYKNHGQEPNNANKVWIRGNDQQPWILVYDLFANQGDVDGTYKLITGIELADSLQAHGQNYSSSFQVRWGQWGRILAADNYGGAGYSFDDIRLYSVTDDIQMVSIDAPIVASCDLSATTQVDVTVRNSANSTISGIPIVLEVDGVVITTETLPDIPANTSISYTFTPGTANLSALGSHTVKVWVDLPSDSHRENDSAIVTLTNSPVIAVSSLNPYLQDFEADNGLWYAQGYHSSWEYGTPASVKISRAASGSKAWKTSVTGNYNSLELSYLYSPCFDISALTAPTLSLSLALDLEDCGGGLCDGAYVEYSEDGIVWNRLGANGQGTNWYNKNYPGDNLWSIENYHRWHVATIPLPNTGISRLRLRIVVISDISVNRDGIGIDDIHIYNNPNGIYDGVTMVSPVSANIAGGSNWVDFTSGGKLVASVKSPTDAMGSTQVQAYINTGAVRVKNNQYYHHRNITIKPSVTTLTDSALVRFYFLDTETEALINATGCGTCSKPSMAYELGVSKYNNSNDLLEDGDIANNSGGNWLFTVPANAVKVPFDKGYYVEFKVKDFSEFWLNNGGFTNDQSLPVQLVSFTARKDNDHDVLTEWVVASEYNVNRYEVELARGNEGYQRNQFVKIGEVFSRGNSTQQQLYNFTDYEDNKAGVRFYRLKIVDNDGSFRYSAVRPVVFNDELTWQIYPNPSKGNFNLVFQVNDGELITVKVYGINGKLVRQYHRKANGFVEKLAIDLEGPGFASGLYMVEAVAGEKKQQFKVIKE